MQKYDEALKIFLQVNELFTDNFEAQFNLGVCQFQLKKYEDSYENLTKSFEIHQTTEGYFNLGVCSIYVKKYKEALENIRIYLQTAPNEIEALFVEAIALYYLQDYENALKSFQMVVQIQNNHFFAINNIGVL